MLRPLLPIMWILGMILLGDASAARAGAVPIKTSGPIDRGTVWLAQWCPSTRGQMFFDGEFTADGPNATIVFRGRIQRITTGPLYMRVTVDNVSVVEKSVYLANSEPLTAPNLGCVVSNPDPNPTALRFDLMSPAQFVYFEDFASPPGSEWDLYDDAFYDPAFSGPNDLGNPPLGPWPTGAVTLGMSSDPGPFASAVLRVDGLTPGQDYVLSYWWWSLDEEVFGALWVEIYGNDPWSDATAAPLGYTGGTRGVAWGDEDDDGLPDIYVSSASGSSANRLYDNTAAGFSDITAPPMGNIDPGNGIAWADHDNDGRLDLYLANDLADNRLFHNTGGSSFADITAAPVDNPDMGRAVAWSDFDRDGRVDLSLANSMSANRLYRNTSAGYLDVTPTMLLGADDTSDLAWGDYDDNGTPDLYVANFGSPGMLLRGDGAGGFVDVSTLAPVDDRVTSATWVDYDGDLDLDLYLGVNQKPNRLLRNDGAVFTDVFGLPLSDFGACVSHTWGDIDNDGDQDLYIVNFNQQNLLLRNDGGGSFTDISSYLAANDGWNFGAAFADYDCDGRVDLYLTDADGPDRLIHNDFDNGNHWLHIDLVGTSSNRAGIGARITLDFGADRQMHEVGSGCGAFSQNSLTAEFGLGASTLAENVTVRWPSGLVQDIGAVAADQKITIIEGVTVAAPPGASARFALYPNRPNPFNPATTIEFELPVAGGVDLEILDVAGRRVRTLLRESGFEAGRHAVTWQGQDDAGQAVASGVYLVRLRSDTFEATRRMTLVR